MESSAPRPAVRVNTSGGAAQGNDVVLYSKSIYLDEDLQQDVNYEPNGRTVQLASYERTTDGSDFDEFTTTWSTSFDVKQILHVGSSHAFVVVGAARNGDVVIERWNVEVLDGGRFGSRDQFSATTGTPYLAGPVIQGIAGPSGVFVPSDQRGGLPA